ncbi:hypothetical protein [Endozoicomonas sp. 8E]|uniref:hypothetical protein n=1 Tax=Endozoicomonas sp. 8E TaxID=3035692 RepID=UPI00293929A4|nr:hypothetical protein [Endozoicomonas sp. 8E]WOG29827.1 hypothetical protein P6910_09270 [Endozoicomonas sp. 8E]
MPNYEVPKKIHVSIVSPIEGLEFAFLKIWAEVNPEYKINIWSPERFIYQKVLYSLLFSEINNNAIEKDDPGDIAQQKDSIWRKIDNFMGESSEIEELNIMESNFPDSVKKEFVIQWNKINNSLDKIKNSISNAIVHKKLEKLEEGHKKFIRYSLSITNSLIIERFIGLSQKFVLGGVYIDKGLLPEMDSHPFLKRSSSLDPISGTAVTSEKEKQLESAKLHALFKKMFSDGTISDPSPYFEKYGTTLSKEEITRIQGIVEESSISDLFHSLPKYDLKEYSRNKLFFSNKVNFEYDTPTIALDDSIQPLMVVSRRGHPTIKLLLDEICLLHKTVENLKKSPLRKKEITLKIREALHKFYTERKVIISDNDIDKIATLSTALLHDIDKFNCIITAKLGYDAFERLINLEKPKNIKIIPINYFIANNLFYNRSFRNLGFNSSPTEGQQSYERLIIVHYSDKHIEGISDSLIHCFKLYNKYRTKKNSVLYNAVDSDLLEIITLQKVSGAPLKNIGKDTKVILTGSLYFYNSDLNVYDVFYYKRLMFKLSAVLGTLIPKNTTVQTIKFFFDNSAQGIKDSMGVLDTSQKNYIVPEVLRNLAKQGIYANSAVAIRGFLSADDPHGPSTSKNAPYPDLNRIVFTLERSGTVKYQAKFGLTSLALENEFIDKTSKEDPNDAKLRNEFTEALLKGELIDTKLNDNLVQAVIEDRSTFAGLEQALFKAFAENELTDTRPEAERSDVGTEAERSNDGTEAEHSDVGTEAERSDVGTEAERSDVGTEAERSDVGTEAQRSDVGTEAQRSDVGTEAERSDVGTEAERSDVGTEAQRSDVGTEAERSDVGTEAQRSDVGTEAQRSDVGTEAERSDVGTEAERSDVGTEAQRSDVGTEAQRSDVGTEAERSDVGTEAERSDVGTEAERSDVGTEAERSDVGTEAERSDVGTEAERSDVGTEVEHSNVDPEGEHSYIRPEGQIGDNTGEENPIDAKLRNEFTKALLKGEFIDAKLEDNLVKSVIKDRSTFARLEKELFEAIGEDEFRDKRKNAEEYTLHFEFKTAIFHGLMERPGTEKATFANSDERETIRLADTLRLALSSHTYTQWLERYALRFNAFDQINQLEQEMVNFHSVEEKTRAFETLKRRIRVKSYDIYTLDPRSIAGAAILKREYKNDFANIQLLTGPLPLPCNRRRRAANTGSCDARRKNLEYALRLLSGPETQLFLGNDREKTDIALREPSNEGERWLQNFFTRYRRLEGKGALAYTRGMHSVIALDRASFAYAQKQIRKGTLSGQPLLLKATPSAGYVLLAPDGRVQSAIAGGDGNRVTVLGRPAKLIAHALTTLVDFTPDGHIATLTVSDLASGNQSRGIKALKTFMTQSPANGKPLVGELIIESKGSNKVFKRLVKDIQRLMPKDRPAIENLVLRSPGTGQPEYRLLPGETTVLMSPRPSDSKAPLRYLPPSHLSVPVQPRTKDSLSGVASERAEFRQRLLEFDTALGDIKARHSLPDSMIPQLDTLRRDGRGWRMDFMEPDTLARKNIRFTSSAFDRFRGFLQGTGRQGFRVKGKKSSTGGLEKLRSFIGLYDLIAGLAPVGHHYSQSPSRNMTDTQRQIYIGRQTLFYTAVALQGMEIINLGRHGIKTIIPAIQSSFPPGQTPPKLPDIPGSGKLPGGLKTVGRLGKKVGRFVPILGLAVPGASLTLTLIEYENEKDPEVKKLMESRVTFEWVDTCVSIISEFLGPVGAFVDGIMHYVRGIFEEKYKGKLEKLAYKKLRDASGKAAKIFDLIHAQLDPKSFLANNQTLNALMSGDGKSLLTLNIQSINLANQTLTYGGGYSFRTTFVAGKKDDWTQKRCKKIPHVPKAPLRHCASDINRIEYSPDTFNLIGDALATLCRTESRLTGYQCSDGVFHNLGQMSDKRVIFMPSVPPWDVKLLYNPFNQAFPGSAPDSSSPGAKLLDAVSDSKLKRFYQKKVKDTRYTECDGYGSCDDISYDYKYIGQMFTHTDSLKYRRRSTSSLYLDDKDHIVVFRRVSGKFEMLLDYDLYSPEGSPKGAKNTNVLISNGFHVIRIHPRETASTWVLNHDGSLPYACITERDDQIQNCQSWLSQTRNPTWDIRLGQALFRFPVPGPSSSHQVVVLDPNAQFEWRPERKVIRRLYDTGTLNDRSSRSSKLRRIMSRYTAASRFLPLELKDCDASPRVLARCMARAPNWWLKSSRKIPYPFWVQHQKDCEREADEYRKKPYRCFPGKLGLARADWDKLDRIRLSYDTLNSQEIRFIAADAQVQPVQGNPAIGYYFFDSANGKVLLQNKEALTREIRHFGELNADLFVFGRHVSKVMPNKDESQLLVFDPPYYYLLTASPSGQLTHQVIAAETLDGQLSVPPIPPAAATETTTYDQGIIPLRVVDDYGKRRILGAGFYDDATQNHIAFVSSFLDGGQPINKDDGRFLRKLSEPVQRALREDHLPVHKVVWGQGVFYILFSEHSGNLYYTTGVNRTRRTGDIQRLSSGFQVIRPAGERRTLAQMAAHPIFTRVQAHSGSLLADTLSGHRLWIPDKAWDNTRVVSENLSLESESFEQWQVEATGQTIAKSNDTLSVRQFTAQSGVVMDSMNLGQIVNQVFAKLPQMHSGRTWTAASARLFIGELKKQLRTLVTEARKQFSATVGLVPLKPITTIPRHPRFRAIRKLDFWYNPGSDTLLAANTRDQFEVMVNDDGQLLALSDTRKEEAFEFFPRPAQGAKGHPFCGQAAAVSLAGVPSEFDALLSVPCLFTVSGGFRLPGNYQWDEGARAWRIETPKAQYLGNRESLALVALDLSLMGPRNTSGSPVFWTRQDFNQAMESLPAGIRQRADIRLIALTLRPGYNPTQVAWMDYRGRSSRQQRLLFGLPGKEHGVQRVIGSTRKLSFPQSTSTVVYNQSNQMLYRVTQKGYQSLGTFGRVAVMAEGLLLSGTPEGEQISLKALRLDTYYRNHQVAFVRNGTRQRFGVMVEGQGGSDVIELDETDLSFFARILIHPGLAKEDNTDHDRAQTRIELKNVPAFPYLAWRRGQNLMLSDRFTTGEAEIEIQQVWARQHDRFLQPTTLVFSDLELSLSDLAARVMDSGQGVVLPLTVSSLVRNERLRFINATASNPLYIQRDRPVKIVTYRAMDGIKLTLEPLDPTYVRRQVFITGTGQWGWEPDSVQVSGAKPGSGYEPWPFIPSVISSSAMGNGTARLWGNSRNNILYLGTDARQWSLQGWDGHDLLLLGASGNIAAQPDVLSSRGDQCDNRKLDAPGNSSLWQAILDWTRPLAGGVGNDVYDLRACRPALTIDSHGKHYILLSSGSRADLRRLSGDNSTALFFTDLTAEQVAFSHCNRQAQSNLTRSNHSLPLDSETFRIINTGTNQTLALVKPDVLASLHFKGGQVSLNPMAVINRNDSQSALDDSVDGDNGALAFLNKIIGRGQRLVNYLCSLAGGKKNDIGSESERPVGTTLNDTELYQHYQRLVQDLSALTGNSSGEIPSFILSESQGMIQNLTSPQPLTTMGSG